MFERFKSKTSKPPKEQVQAHLKELGYTLTPQGEAVTQTRLDAGNHPAEVAVYIAIVTIAYDLQHAGAAATALLRFRPQAVQCLRLLDHYRDQGWIVAEQWQGYRDALIGVSSITAEQGQWIERLLADPDAAARLARAT